MTLWNREIFRLKSRQFAIKIAKYIFQRYLTLIYLLAFLSLLFLPLLHEEARPDEKALLIGQVLICLQLMQL
jgi:hypothetical protein